MTVPAVFWWVLLVPAAGGLGRALVTRHRYRRRGEATPHYQVGDIPGALSFILIIVFQLLGYDGPVAVAAAVASFILLAFAIVSSVRAYRRRTWPTDLTRGEAGAGDVWI